MDAGAKLLLLVCLVVLPLSAWAQEIEPLTDEEEETLAFALKHANAAIAALEDRAGECNKAGWAKALDPTLFKSFSFSNLEWRYALSALNHRAMARCFNKDGVHHRAMVALMLFRNIEKYHTGKNVTKMPYNPELICCLSGMLETHNEMQYSKFDPKIRQRLEAIPGINEPFDLLVTFETVQAIHQPPVGKK